VDRHHFRQMLFGGRAVVTGGIFIVTPLTPAPALFRLARAVLRGASVLPSPAPEAPSLPRPREILERVGRASRWLLGLPSGPASQCAPGNDLTISLPLTRAEAEHGGQKRLTLDQEGARHEVLVTIPPGLRPAAQLRLRGKGPDHARPPARRHVSRGRDQRRNSLTKSLARKEGSHGRTTEVSDVALPRQGKAHVARSAP
jgi:hypothetical protein